MSYQQSYYRQPGGYQQSYYGQPGGYQQSYDNTRLASDGSQSYYQQSYEDSTPEYQNIVKSVIDRRNQQPKDKEYQKHQAEQDEDDIAALKRFASEAKAQREYYNINQQYKPRPESFYSGTSNQYVNFFRNLTRVENRRYKFDPKYGIDQISLRRKRRIPLLGNY